ncbi:peptidylprolyl isomerase [Myxosarcina sp. GI1]|uniref:peptidylprolyl isomerase n=1 Tax=Myxosarcina sp. GI1 TaxID=1541065 RepID=UPI00055EEC5A|nr:peptidylprolyl isomerase [Myxosarcina sp. GI1]
MVQFHKIHIEPIAIEQHLKQELKLNQTCCEILQQEIVERVASQENIAVTPEEIQAEANQIRMSKRLEKASDTIAWLQDNLLDPDEWEVSINKRLLAKKVAHHLFDKQAVAYFAQNRLDYDQFNLYQLIVPYEKLAQELFYQIEEEEISFYQAAHLYDIDAKRRQVCGYEGKVHRWNFAPDIAAAIFKTPIPVGEIIGPIQSERGYHLFLIEEYIAAQLTPERRQEIIDELFKQWLNSELDYMLLSEKTI